MSSAQSLFVAALAPVAPAAAQLPLLSADGSKPVVDGQARENSGGTGGAGAVGERAPGRPKGSPNRFNRDLVKVISYRLGRHPLEEVARLYMLSNDELRAEWPGLKPAAVKERLLSKLVDATTQKPGVAIENQAGGNVTVIFKGFDDGPDADSEDGDAVLELPPNEFNDLGEVAA